MACGQFSQLFYPQRQRHYSLRGLHRSVGSLVTPGFQGIFGSPAYVLAKELQDGSSLNKWHSRAWQGIYIGNSTCHSSAIPLIYNPKTTHISPQYHIIYDEYFQSVAGHSSNIDDTYLDKLAQSSARWLYKDPYTDEPHLFESYWDNTCQLPAHKKRKLCPPNHLPSRGSLTVGTVAKTPLMSSGAPSTNLNNGTLNAQSSSCEGAAIPTSSSCDEPPDPGIDVATQKSETACIHAAAIKRSSTSDRPQYHYVDYTNYFQSYKRQRGMNGAILVHVAHCPDHSFSTPIQESCATAPLVCAFTMLPPDIPETTFQVFPVVDNKADILTQSQMLKASDAPQFVASQPAEISGLINMGVFEIKHISQKPPTAHILSSIWSYRRKRSPPGKILKHKTRICVDGSQQEFGRDFWEVYAPVVSWSTIHLMLLLSSILNLKERQVDYTQAFPQAPLEDPVFAVRNWFHHLTQGLLKEGFCQSASDPCLFLRRDCILIVYTNDCIIFSKEDQIIDNLLHNLSQMFSLEDQGSVQDYLGIRIIKDPATKTISMTQPGLIDSILQDLNLLQDSKSKDTTSVGILYPDRDGIPHQDTWNYQSVIGKLNYIAQNTRPDISFAVHQCARYSSNPTALHELAVKRIGRYLLATKDKGLILHPTHDFKLDMFIDADFAGMWHREYSELRECALSCTGYIITYCGCPIHWASKLQSEIALSATESEYIALSIASRELLPLR
jgi:hypothetical protein